MEDLYQELIQIIEEELQEKGKEYTLGKFTGLGWRFPEGENGVPKISLKKYEKTVNLYLFPTENGEPLLAKYEKVFKNSNIGKGCLRIKKLDEEKATTIRLLLHKS
ncbi:hypothetical protein [Enterococcus sp. DIV0876]|uniref:hypothetical protein n=1 Tax=Enterococcus sp. DIV0876 TaxID=2774633 RepID=UPI003D300156